MVLQSSGAISLNDIQNEFGGSNPIGINEYYSVASGIPSSGTISLNQFYGTSADTWEIIMHTDGFKGSGNNIGNSAAFGYTGTSTWRSVTSTTTGAYNRRQIGDGVGLYAGYFYKKNIKQFALISGTPGQSLQSPSSHASYHVWDAFSADRDGHTDTGNESTHELLLRLDTYNVNNASWANTDTAFTGSSVRSFTAGTNGYSVSSSSAYPNPPTMIVPPIGGGGGTFTHTFTNAGATGPNGPTLSQIQSAYSSTSWASDTSKLNMTTQGYQTWTVPSSGTYKFTIRGAMGGSGLGSGRGGYSRYVIGQVALTVGEKLIFAVGQAGSRIVSYLSHAQHSPHGGHHAGSGGGGTFVVRENGGSHIPLLVAGGGGGGGWLTWYSQGQLNPRGQDVPSSSYSTTQIGNNHKNNGDGGDNYPSNYGGGAGGGWNSNGDTFNLAWDMQNLGYPYYSLGSGEGGYSWTNGLIGGDGVKNHNTSGAAQFGNRTSGGGAGGFGGGGGAYVDFEVRAGAGGGYSGGEGGSYEETGANNGMNATPPYATHELASGSGGNYINSTYVTTASYGNQETSAQHGSILVEQLTGGGTVTRPDKFAIWGVNCDADNDTQVLAAYSGTLGVGNGKNDYWRGNNPRETYWSYWGNDWHSSSSGQTIGGGRQTDPGISTHATNGHTGPVYLIAYGPPSTIPYIAPPPLTYNGTNYSTGNSFTLNGSQAEHVFSISSGAQIRFELYGGAGGRGAWNNNTEYGGPGGRVDVTISFTSAATIYAYVGMGNMLSSGRAGSGGGSTDIRTAQASSGGSVTNTTFISNFYSGMSSTLAVAGGGGGAHGDSYGGWGHSSGNGPGSGGPNTSDTNSRGTNDGGYTATGASTTSPGYDGGSSTSTQYTSHGTFGGALPPSNVGISRAVWAPSGSGSYSGYGWPNGGTGSSWATGGGGGGYYGGASNWPNGGGGSNFIYTSSWGLGTITTNNNTVAVNPVNGILTVTIL